MDINVGLLGPVELTLDGASITIARRQVRGVLAILALRPGRTVAVDGIVDALWDGRPPQDPCHAVHVYVSRLRSCHEAVAEAVETELDGYRLAIPPDQVDINRFRELATEGRRRLDDDPAAALTLLDAALDLWRGPALGCFRYAEFAGEIVRRLEDEQLDASEDRYEASIRLGEARRVIPAIQELVDRNPYREHPVALLMSALIRDERRIEAIAVYRRHADRLEADLGVEPSMSLQTMAYEAMRPRLVQARRRHGDLLETRR